MRRRRPDRARIVAAAVLAAVGGLLGVSLLDQLSPWGGALSRASYESYFAWFNLGASLPAESPVVIAYLDLESYRSRGLDPAQPWPRELHAQLVRRLKASGARAVIFDVVFDRAGTNAAADHAFRNALAEHGRVILAGELRAVSTDASQAGFGRPVQVVMPAEEFRGVATWGLGELAADEDFLVRRFYPGQGGGADATPSLTVAAGRAVGLERSRLEGEGAQARDRWLNYYGPPFTLPHRSVDQILEPGALPETEFRERMVFVGARPVLGQFTDRRDEFRSPFRGWRDRDRFIPGVEVHATQMLNLLRNDWLTKPADRTLAWWILASGMALGAGLVLLRPLAATVAAVTAGGVVAAVAVGFFLRGQIWFPWLIVAGVQLPLAWAGAVAFRSMEWYLAWRRMEAARRVAEARIREQAALLDKAGDAIMVEDLEGRITYANPSALRSLGDAVKPGGVGLGTVAGVAEARRVTRERGEWNGELRLAGAKGQALITESRWTLVRNEGGTPTGLLVLCSDVTEKRQLEAETLRLQRMEAVGALAGGMAHDLNNALAPVLMGTQMLRREARDENSQRILSLMESSTRRGADMVRQVLLFARGRAGEATVLEAAALLREMEKLVRDTFPPGIRVSVQIARDLWPIRGNATQLHQVLLNLCVNARDAMPEGGALSLAADNVELDEESARRLPEARPGNYVVLMVSDTGSGMPEEVRAKVFEPFFTTKPEGRGTGLGLSTTVRIVRAHGGFIQLQSAVGEGTTFEIYLPRLEMGAIAAEDRPVSRPVRGRGELVLVADDDEAVREVLRRGLEDHGYRVVLAGNGVEAVSAFKQHPDVAILVTDRAMPAMDGLKAAAALRRVRPGLPVLFLSGEGEFDEPVPAGDGKGPAQTRGLTKPVELEALLGAVAEMVGGRKPASV